MITQRGRPAVRVVPIDDGTAQCLFGYMKGPGESLGDIVQMPQEPRATEMGEEDAPAARLLVATARFGGYTLVARDRNSRLRQNRARERAGCLRRGQPGMDHVRSRNMTKVYGIWSCCRALASHAEKSPLGRGLG